MASSVLVIETAAPRGGVLLWRENTELMAEFSSENQHAQRLVQLIAGLLPTVDPSVVDLIVVDRGPGSHTGVRIGLAAARMLGWQGKVPVLGVSALEALALEAAVPKDEALTVVLPCRAGVVYAQRFWGAVPAAEPCLADVRHEVPADWRGGYVVGQGTAQEAVLAEAIRHGDLRTVPNAPMWPGLRFVLRVGWRQAETLPHAEWERTLVPLYLSPVMAKTLAQRTETPAKGASPHS